MQIIPTEPTVSGLILEYAQIIWFPIIPIRNLITQFVEIKFARNQDSQVESALRSTFDGTGYWINAIPRARKPPCIDKDLIVGYGSGLKNSILRPFHKHTIQLPIECEAITKISKEDIPLLLQHKFTVTQSRVTRDTTIVTKVCYTILILHWLCAISSYAYALWTTGWFPFNSHYFEIISIVAPLLYTFEKSVAPVFVSLESDELFLKKDFVLVAERNTIPDHFTKEKVSNTKESVAREIHIRYSIERVVGSLTCLLLFVILGQMQRWGNGSDSEMTENPPMAPVDINGTIWTIIYYVHPHILLIEAVMHSVKSLTELGQAYFTNKPLIKVLKFLEYFVLASYNLTLYSRHLTLVLSAYLWPLMDYIFPFLEDTTL